MQLTPGAAPVPLDAEALRRATAAARPAAHGAFNKLCAALSTASLMLAATEMVRCGEPGRAPTPCHMS